MEDEVSFRPAEREPGAVTFEVTVGTGRGATTHQVRVTDADLEDFAPGARPEELLAFAFGFLLERESKDAILRRFDIGVIADYFPEFVDAARAEFPA